MSELTPIDHSVINELKDLDTENMMVKIVMIIAPENFRDEELSVPKSVFEGAGATVHVASTSIEEARGKLGMKISPDMLVKDIKAENYDVIIFVGGSGASCYFNSKTAHDIAKSAYLKNKLICAICAGPVILANAGVLEGKKATVFPSFDIELKQKGAIYTGKPVQTDGNIVTASGPQSAKRFAKEIMKLRFS